MIVKVVSICLSKSKHLKDLCYVNISPIDSKYDILTIVVFGKKKSIP